MLLKTLLQSRVVSRLCGSNVWQTRLDGFATGVDGYDADLPIHRALIDHRIRLFEVADEFPVGEVAKSRSGMAELHEFSRVVE